MFDFWSHSLVLGQAVDGQAGNLLSGLSPDQRTGILVVAIGCATGAILGLGGMIYCAVDSMHRRRMELGLKREMIERGMTADEIAKIIECAAPLEDATQRWIASWGDKKTG
jgi:hypothetical protein